MKRLLTGGIAFALALMCTVSTFAMQVPNSTVVQNLNGVQQYIKTFTVPVDVDPQELIEQPFEYEGFLYSFKDITKQENEFEAEKEHTETITVETAKKDLSAILDVLEPTMEYDDGRYSGILALDHTTIHTEPAGYTTGSYTIRETKQIGNCDSNDMAYVPGSTVKDGKTIQLESVDWQVQSTALVDDVLVPSSYVAIATYSGKASYTTPTGYITTVDYTGTVSCEEIKDVTYTVVYIGEPSAQSTEAKSLPVLPSEDAQAPASRIPLAAGLAGALLIAGAVFLVVHLRKRRYAGYVDYRGQEDMEHEAEQ